MSNEVPSLDEVEDAIEDYAVSYLEQVKENFEQERDEWMFREVEKVPTDNKLEWNFAVDTCGTASSHSGREEFVVWFTVMDNTEKEGSENIGYGVFVEVLWTDGEIATKYNFYDYDEQDWVWIDDVDELKSKAKSDIPLLKPSTIGYYE